MPAGVLVEQRERSDARRGEAAVLSQEVVLELERGRGEHRDEEAGAGEEPQPPAVCRERRFGVLPLESAALRQPAADDDDQREAEQRDRVDPAPTSVAGVGQRQHPDAHAGAAARRSW